MYSHFASLVSSALKTALCGCAVLLLSLGFASSPVAAQPSGATGVTVGAGEALQIGGLVQADAILGRETLPDGFRARSARLRLGGEAEALSYVLQTDFASSSALLDAFVQVPLADRMRLRGGLFKTPYSAELLTSRSRLRFAERARVVNALAPARQAGVQLAADLTGEDTDTPVTATVGVFNGTRGLTSNDNDHFLYMGRLVGNVPVGPGELEWGASAGYSIDDGVTIPNTTSSFFGSRLLAQADAQYETGRWLFAGEIHAADLDSDPPAFPESQSPFGFYLTAGADLGEGHQVLARVEGYDPDTPAPAPDEQLVLGYNYDISSLSRVVVNYQASSGDLAGGFLTGRLQVAF